MKRTLQLRREVLTELTDAELAGVGGGEDDSLTLLTIIVFSLYVTCRCQLEPTLTCA